MADEIETSLATLLRQIAKVVKGWENRDLAEMKARGASRLSRPAYFADLEAVAAMLEGTHVEHRLRRENAGVGRPSSVEKVERDLKIARLILEQPRTRGWVGEGIKAAMRQCGVSEGTARAAWLRMHPILESPDAEFLIHMEKLVARGLVTATKHKVPKNYP